MNKKAVWLIVLLILAALVAVWFLVQAPEQREVTGTETKIAATIPPLHSIASAIAGDTTEIELVLPSGASPHTFEPTASDLARLEGVNKVFAIGQGLDNWAAEIASSTGAETVTVEQGIELIPTAEEHELAEELEHDEGADTHEHEHHGEYNPHYWLSAENAKQIARNIAAELTALDPNNQKTYERNLANYLSELDQLDSAIRSTLSDLRKRDLVTFHDAWPYFAQAYDLTVVATFEPVPGKEPTPQYLKELQDTVTEYDIATIFTEPQLSTQSLQSFLDDMNVEVAVLDPLGTNSYLEMMRFNAETIANNL